MSKRLLYSFLFLFFALSVAAQRNNIIVAGQVVDKGDKEPIPGAVVYFENSKIATTTNEEGFFLLQSPQPQEKIIVSILGYKTQQIKIKQGQNVGLDIFLEEDLKQLQEFILYGPNTKNLMQRARENRKENNYDSFKDYIPVVTAESKASLKQLSKKIVNNKMFGELRRNMIMAQQDSSLLLPIYMNNETYQIKDKEKIQLTFEQKSIIPEHSKAIAELITKFPSELNFYDSYLLLFGKNFMSPLAPSSDSYYRYTIMDSTQTESGKQYTVRFRPQNDKYLLFKGEMVIDSASCAIKRISAMILPSANLNFIEEFFIEQNFRPYSNGKWVLNDQQLVIGAQLISQSKKKTANSFFVTRNLIISDSKEKDLPKPLPFQAELYSSDFSNTLDNLGKTKTSQIFNQVSNVLMNDYLDIGPVNWGPILLVAGTNKPEGTHIMLSGRTSKKVFENLTIGPTISYGFGDETWKFGGEVQYRFKNQKYAVIGARFDDNYYQSDFDFHDELNYENSVSNGIADITSFFFHEFNDKYNRRQIGKVFYNKQWFNDFNTQTILSGTRYFSNQYVPYQSGDIQYNTINDYRLSLDFRYSHKQHFIDNFFHRIFINNHRPVVHFAVETGKYFMDDISNYYLKLHLAEKHTIMLGAIGKLNYSLQAGHIFGRVPFPLLEIYSGIENYGMQEFNYYMSATKQYAADSYANLESQFITNGFIFNNIPLIKKLNLREIISLKIATGRLSEKQLTLTDLPAYIQPLDEPYLWLGFGICNLFKLLAIEYIMEMPQISEPTKVSWNLRCRIFVDF